MKLWIRWADQAAHMSSETHTNENLNRTDLLEDPGIDESIILNGLDHYIYYILMPFVCNMHKQ
jgi:hypothetical protein